MICSAKIGFAQITQLRSIHSGGARQAGQELLDQTRGAGLIENGLSFDFQAYISLRDSTGKADAAALTAPVFAPPLPVHVFCLLDFEDVFRASGRNIIFA